MSRKKPCSGHDFLHHYPAGIFADQGRNDVPHSGHNDWVVFGSPLGRARMGVPL